MSNPFLSKDNRDIETAILFENAYIHDIGTAVAYTDGNRVFLNTEDNLYKILPAYNDNMLKWLLWHERFHIELRHHDRFFKYVLSLPKKKINEEFALSKNEVNIIMDILVHDSLIKMFPELVETATNNLAQLRNRNSFEYTFTTFTLEEMLEEYKNYKENAEKEEEGNSEEENGNSEEEEGNSEEGTSGSNNKGEASEDKKSTPSTDKKEDKKAEEDTTTPSEAKIPHEKADWSKLEDINTTEFIDRDEADDIVHKIRKLKQQKVRLGHLTKTLNGLATTTRKRSYAMPSTIFTGQKTIFKGRVPGKATLYLCFDASGSMAHEMELFKEIITNSIPHALNTPTLWFSGYGEKVKSDPEGRSSDYYKGTFKDFLPVLANYGYDDDGDRTIELCWRAEQLGYSPIGITDGGGHLTWSKDLVKQLKRTILVGQNAGWLLTVKSLNDKIQIIEV